MLPRIRSEHDEANTTGDSTAALRDAIQDFSIAQGDRIALSAIDADPLLEGDLAFAWLGSAVFAGAGAAGRLRFTQGSTTVVEADTNGDGVADLVINLAESQVLTQNQFIL